MRVRIIAIGRLKAGPERDLTQRYLDRACQAGRGVSLSGFDVIEIAESRDRDMVRRREQEAASLMARSEGARRIVFDERGRDMSSRDFAETLGNWRDSATPETCLLIGGPDGHGSAAPDRSDLVLSLGRMTWPHQMVRIMLAEQLYRAVTILSGHPYHRA